MKPLMFQQFIKGKSCRWFSLFTIGLLFFFTGSCQAATATTTATGQNLDAVAIRILPNVEHYGIERWYAEQGFSGSPQYLIVDGYEAIRDGRTVYVNATNIVSDKIYTNIYLISYNQDSKPGTADALAQIIANWKFNNNLSATGQCAYTVAATSTCLVDSDCLGVGFCDTIKAKITRDVKRLAVLAEIKDSLKKYKETNNKYPDLPTGSYLPHLTVSTWPSWQSTFAAQLNLDKSLVDPINKLGACAGYDATTCWNKNLSTSAIKMATSSDDSTIKLPDNSLVMAYQSQNSGNRYILCASMESVNTYNTEDGLLKTSACSVKLGSASTSSGLAFEAFNLQGELNSEFNGYVKVANPNGNPLTWELFFKDKDQVTSAFQPIPVLVNTNNPNQRKIYSKSVKKEGTFPITIKVTDNRTGFVASTSANIVIGRNKPRIEAESTDFILNNNTLSYVFYINDSSIPSGSWPSYTLKLNNTSWSSTDTTVNINNGLKLKIEQVERGRFKLTIFQSGQKITDVSSTSPETIFKYSVALKSGNVSTNKDFTITLKQDKPIFDYQCEENTRKYDNYNCLIKLSNSDDHNIGYTVAGLSSSNLATSTTATNTITISGHVIANNVPTPPTIGDFGTCTTGKTVITDTSAIQNLLNTYKSIFPTKIIKFKLYPTATSTPVINRFATSTGGVENNESKQVDNKVLPASSLLSPILKTFAFVKASFQTGEALAREYNGDTGDTGGTCQTTDKLYDKYLEDLRGLDETISTTTPQSVFKIDITAKNEYGAFATSTFSLKVNTYCGDGVKQAPNQEKRGGLYNDGVEECDGVAGVAINAADSSATKQYSCTTGINRTTAIPNPITSNNFCRTTGGYCGDGLCGETDDTYGEDNAFEKYDPGNNSDQYCHADCAYCGDGTVQADKGELCDPGDPYSVQSSLGEVCNKKCKIVRELKILQVYPSNSTDATDHTISAEAALNSLRTTAGYSLFKDSIAISDNASTTEADYNVDKVTMEIFNTSTTDYLPTGDALEKYNLIIFGFGSGYLSTSTDLSSAAKVRVESFIKNGGMVVFGKETITGTAIDYSASRSISLHTNFDSLADYAGISGNYTGTENNLSVIAVNNSEAFRETQLFTLPTTSFLVNSYQAGYKIKNDGSACGGQCFSGVCSGASSLLMNWFHTPYTGRIFQGKEVITSTSWASVCNRVGLMQLSSTVDGIKSEELQVFGNLIYHLSTLVSGDNF